MPGCLVRLLLSPFAFWFRGKGFLIFENRNALIVIVAGGGGGDDVACGRRRLISRGDDSG